MLGSAVLPVIGLWLDLQLRRMYRNEARLSAQAWGMR
ncbi:hypothetical protein FHY19_000501 [Xanthomonas arboricola]|nr:hypothetical protein [Xanthomonas sp. 4461]